MNYFLCMSFKRIYLLIFISFCCTWLHAQRFKGEIIAGANFTQVDGDMEAGFKKVGVKAGLGVMYPFSFDKYNPKKNWSVSMEILYNQKGARQRQFDYNIDTSDWRYGVKFKYKLNLDYISIPVLFQYTHRQIWSIAVGFQYSRLVNVKEIEYDVKRVYDNDTVVAPKPNDWSVLVDVRVRIWQQLKAGFRFEYSMVPIRTRHFNQTAYYNEQTRKQYNNSLSLYLIVMFNEKKSENTEKIKKPTDRTYYY